jgi:hypothetical protein
MPPAGLYRFYNSDTLADAWLLMCALYQMPKVRLFDLIVWLLRSAYTITMCSYSILRIPEVWADTLKKMVVEICQTPTFESGRIIPHVKCHFFFDSNFLMNGRINLLSNLAWREMCFLYIHWCQEWWVFFHGLPPLGGIPISRCFDALYRRSRHIQNRTSLSLVSFDRYGWHFAPCDIWRWVVHLRFEK